MFPSQYLAAVDLSGREVKVEIAGVSADDVKMEGGKAQKKLLIAFVGKQKKMICNKTNAKKIAALYGNETNEWKGQTITLHTEMVEAFGKNQEAIRVK